MKVKEITKKAKGAALVLLATTLWACGEPGVPDVVLPEPVEDVRVLLESQLALFGPEMARQAKEEAIFLSIAEFVESEAARPFARRVEDGLRYSTAFQREYLTGNLRAAFADQAGLTARGEEVVRLLADASRHGIDPEPFHLQRIEQMRAELASTEEALPGEFHFEPDEVEALMALAETLSIEVGAEEIARVLIEALLQLEEEALPAELARPVLHYQELVEAGLERARLIARLELYVADGALRYAREMRHANLNRLDWRQLRDAGGSTEVILGRMQATLADLVQTEDAAEVYAVFQALEPQHPQYRALLAATDRYRKIVADGGWERVRSFRVEEGARSERVLELRHRLEREGYVAFPVVEEKAVEEVEELDEQEEVEKLEEVDGIEEQAEVEEVEEVEVFDPLVVDESLLAGIRHYQQTHQMEVDGQPTVGFWRSINISAEERLAQMELTLQRWRESHLEDEREFIFVNIPDFHAEVYRDGERQMRFPVVVGRSNRVCDRETNRWVYPNATPVLMSKMDHIIVNPSWYVPPRLVRESLEPRVRQNPNYFEEAGFEEIRMADGRKVVRQLPGPENALGLVKFMFPNEHNVYLHDTPQKQYFERRIRTFSFGCVRVSQPLELARYLLEREGREAGELEQMIESGRTRQVNFAEPLPVITEYYTVWIDDEGWPNFLADPYDKDARRQSEEPEEFDRCRVQPRVQPTEVIDDVGP